ncbi:DNA protecting protein DprA [Roseivivax lentus]|uniref:DNA protecting protein DprA n=1 Tax=Roseivivax lentus TaxID=633194 RepID=A0A1N7NI78_9RHOB|nr:DNA-processing protein DprA [Roseivivax lentus]SIS97997.1 DNA protecting protein DprA [Roseivivax lentus]
MAEDHPSSTHPPIPPTTEDDRFDRLRLLRSRRVGIATYRRLMAEHGTARAALDALPDIARGAGLADYHTCPDALVDAELRAGRREGARLIFEGEPDYPSAMCDIDDAPPCFWAIGDVAVLSRPLVAMVGARNASSLGLRMARALAADLGAAGLVVVSGLARGIDAAAHDAALRTGTVAVMGGGVDVLYPQENARLAQEIVAAGGLRISEQPMTLAPKARHFPLRNRLISGLSRAVIVVEAALKSGSLITARTALDQGRDVMAVPGHPFDARAGGCNALIRDGAQLVRGSRDVRAALGMAPFADMAQAAGAHDIALRAGAGGPDAPCAVTAPVPGTDRGPADRRTLRETADLHSQILQRLGPSPIAEDQLIRDLDQPMGRIGPVLTDLELEGRIARAPGGMLALKLA